MTTVGVAVPTAGRPAMLRRALRSLLDQTRGPDEVVVSEDGADVATEQAVEEARRAGLPVTLYRNERPLGQRGNRQRAFELTTADYVAMLDDDDEYEAAALERLAAALDEHAEAGFASADQWIIDEAGVVLADESKLASQRFGRHDLSAGIHKDVLERQLKQKPFSLCATLFRRATIADAGFFPEGSGTACDFALFVELGARRVASCYVPARLGRYRVHPGQVTLDRISPGTDAMQALASVSQRYRLTVRERRSLDELYRDYAVGVAIGYAHRRQRRAAVRTLARFGDQGWGKPRQPRRLATLALLLLGARPEWRRTLKRR